MDDFLRNDFFEYIKILTNITMLYHILISFYILFQYYYKVLQSEDYSSPIKIIFVLIYVFNLAKTN